MKHTAHHIIRQGLFFTVASIAGNVLNLVFNFYLGRYLLPVDFSLVALFMGILYAVGVFFNALAITVSHSVGVSSASVRSAVIAQISSRWKKSALILGLVVSFVWIVTSPLLAQLWKVDILSLIFFFPIFILGTLAFVNRGILQGELRFSASGSIFLAESGMKLLAALAFVTAGLAGWAYIAIPISVLVAYIVSEWCLRRNPSLGNEKLSVAPASTARIFPRRFFVFSFLLGLSTLTFLSIDVLLAKAFFSAEDAGAYALITLGGKMIFLFSSLLGAMSISMVSNALGKEDDTKSIFRVFFSISFLFVACGTVSFLLFGERFFLFFFGQKVAENLPILPMYILAIAAFSLSHAIVLYHHAKRDFVFPILSSISAILLIVGTLFFHDTLEQFVWVLFSIAGLDLIVVSVLHIFFSPVMRKVKNEEIVTELSFVKDEYFVEQDDENIKKVPTVTIGIPAYNEQYNICNILDQLLSQKQDGFVVEKIIVASDGSTDDTVQIASKYVGHGVVVLEGKENRGQNYRQNEIISHTTSDVLVLINADISLGNDQVISSLVSPIILDGADLSAQWARPLVPKTFLERILCSGFDLKYCIYTRHKGGDNIFTCVGHMRALSRKFYSNVIFPSLSDGEDQYLYLFAMAGGYTYRHARNAKAYFRLPNSFRDYKKYARRIFQTQKKHTDIFSEAVSDRERRIPLTTIFLGCAYSIIKRPFTAPLYIVLHIIMQQWSLRQSVNSSNAFDISASTKRLS